MLAKKWYWNLQKQDIPDSLFFEKFYIKLLGKYVEKADGKTVTMSDLTQFEEVLNWLECEDQQHHISNMNRWMMNNYL